MLSRYSPSNTSVPLCHRYVTLYIYTNSYHLSHSTCLLYPHLLMSNVLPPNTSVLLCYWHITLSIYDTYNSSYQYVFFFRCIYCLSYSRQTMVQCVPCRFEFWIVGLIFMFLKVPSQSTLNDICRPLPHQDTASVMDLVAEVSGDLHQVLDDAGVTCVVCRIQDHLSDVALSHW